MSERMQKNSWFVNWKSARDKERAACISGDFSGARFWAETALNIEIVFASFFGQEFGAYLADRLA